MSVDSSVSHSQKPFASICIYIPYRSTSVGLRALERRSAVGCFSGMTSSCFAGIIAAILGRFPFDPPIPQVFCHCLNVFRALSFVFSALFSGSGLSFRQFLPFPFSSFFSLRLALLLFPLRRYVSYLTRGREGNAESGHSGRVGRKGKSRGPERRWRW